jgi:hypothetical protein
MASRACLFLLLLVGLSAAQTPRVVSPEVLRMAVSLSALCSASSRSPHLFERGGNSKRENGVGKPR